MKENLLILLLMIIIVPIAGELKFFPFHDTFRVSLGIPVFFFFLLWVNKINPIISGSLVGLFVVAFRVACILFTNENVTLLSAFIPIFPSFFYYLSYSALFYMCRVNKLHHVPQRLGVIAVFIEISSSVIEVTLRHFMLGNAFTIYIFSEIIVIAIIRSFFTLSFFYMIKLNRTYLAGEQQREQNKQMLLLISSLYEESVLLKKSIQNAEEITRDCYNLYESSKTEGSNLEPQEISQKLLSIAGEVHEIKKDNQRINAGLMKIISNENPGDFMDINYIGEVIIQTNKRYSESLNKRIDFNLDIRNKLPKLHAFTILSLINNLVSNSVESIKDSGKINIEIGKKAETIEFKVSDNGFGIPDKKLALIFKPGYTTKYDDVGNPSNGMGLPYVEELVTKLGGIVSLKSNQENKETIFVIRLPIKSLQEKG